MKTRNQAINHARENVTSLYPFAGQWRFRRYDVAKGAAWESIPRDYSGAQVARAQALVDSARDYLELEPLQYDGGAWIDYV
jgi:hypothetical protein